MVTTIRAFSFMAERFYQNRHAAQPPDVRKGYAFPAALNYNPREAEPRAE